MSVKTSSESLIVIGSTNLAVSPQEALRFDNDGYVQFLEESGFDVEEGGFEWTPIRFPRAVKAAGELASGGYMHSLHESWRERTWGDVGRMVRGPYKKPLDYAKEPIKEALINVAFPLLHKSYAPLQNIQQKAGRPLPIIIHPPGQKLGRMDLPPKQRAQELNTFGGVWFQVTAEWAAYHGISPSASAEQIVNKIKETHTEQHTTGTVGDTTHAASERKGERFADPVSLFGELMKRRMLDEVQLSLRPDFGGDKQDLQHAINGNIENTIHGEMLVAMAEELTPDQIPYRLVVEIADSEIPYKDTRSPRTAINDSVRALVAKHVRFR